MILGVGLLCRPFYHFPMKKFLTKKQRKELLDELQLERVRRYAERIKVILLLDEGKTYKSIAEYLFLDEGIIANYRKRYKKGGLDELVNDDYSGKKAMLSEKELEILDAGLQSKVFLTTKEIISYVEKKFGVKYSKGGMTELLHRLGFSFKKPKVVPGKADREEQEKFVKEYEQLKSQGETVYFGDAAHPTHNTAINYGWIKRGKEFEIRTNSGRHRLNINGAINIDSMDVVANEYETINQYSICDFLTELRAKHKNGERITLVLDNAGYNKAKSVVFLAEELNINLLYLPTYSLNLNPIERLWKFLRKTALPNEYVESFAEWWDGIMGFFREIKKYRPELKTLITDNFKLVGT